MFGRPPFPSEGLYDGQHEHDACGVAFVATLTGEPSHDIVAKALTALRNLEHRGASGAEPDSGDGAGILIQIPDAFYRKVCEFELPVQRGYATGIAFLPADPTTPQRQQTGSRSWPPRRTWKSWAGGTSRPTRTCSARPHAR